MTRINKRLQFWWLNWVQRESVTFQWPKLSLFKIACCLLASSHYFNQRRPTVNWNTTNKRLLNDLLNKRQLWPQQCIWENKVRKILRICDRKYMYLCVDFKFQPTIICRYPRKEYLVPMTLFAWQIGSDVSSPWLATGQCGWKKCDHLNADKKY